MFVEAARAAIDNAGVFRMAVSGGATPKGFFQQLAEDSASRSLPWDKIQVFWVDERCVAPDSPDSNYKLAFDTFISKLPIPQNNIYRIKAENKDIAAAARDYQRQIILVFGCETGQTPQFDFIVLGMGADGHIASLFPNSDIILNENDLVAPVVQPVNGFGRITITPRLLLAARKIIVLIWGSQKADILQKAMSAKFDPLQFPVHILRQAAERAIWIVDKSVLWR